VSGMQRVRPKAVVEVKMQDPPKPPESPLERVIESGRASAAKAAAAVDPKIPAAHPVDKESAGGGR